MRLPQNRTAFVTPEKYNEMKESQLDGRLELKEFTEINHEQGIAKSCETFLADENRTLNEVNAAISLWVAASGMVLIQFLATTRRPGLSGFRGLSSRKIMPNSFS